MSQELITTQQLNNLPQNTKWVHTSEYAKLYRGYRAFGLANFENYMRGSFIDWQLLPHYLEETTDMASVPPEDFPVTSSEEWQNLISKNALTPSIARFIENYTDYSRLLQLNPQNALLNPTLNQIVGFTSGNEGLISDFMNGEDNETIHSIRKNMAITAVLPLLRTLTTRNNQTIYRSMKAEAVAELNHMEYDRHHSWGQRFKRFFMGVINKPVNKLLEPISLTNGVDTAPVLNMAKCTESHTIGGAGDTLFYTLRQDAQTQGLKLCIDERCPLLRRGCVRAIIMRERLHSGKLPQVEVHLKNMIADENQDSDN